MDKERYILQLISGIADYYRDKYYSSKLWNIGDWWDTLGKYVEERLETKWGKDKAENE